MKISSSSTFDQIKHFGLTLNLPKSPAVVDGWEQNFTPYILDLNLEGIDVIIINMVGFLIFGL